jgi:hypothetical protein
MHVRRSLVAALGLVLAAASAAGAAPIVLPSGGGQYQVNFYEPVGQSFTAEDPFVTAGLSFSVINPQFANDDQVEYRLYAGQGVGGALLGAVAFSLADGFSGFFEADFSGVALTVGQSYTLVASILGDSPYWAVDVTQVAYAGGMGVLQGGLIDQDFALRVTPVGAAAVPEPATLLLVGSGLAAAGLRRRAARRR